MHHMTSCAHRRGEAGQTLVVGILFMTAILMFVGLVVDAGMYWKQQRDMQGVADSAALAAAQQLPEGETSAEALALDYVENQNFQVGGTLDAIEFDGDGLVRVTTRTTGITSFGKLMGRKDPTIRATAAARIQMVGWSNGMLPLALMRDNYSPGDNVAIKFSDNSSTGNHGAVRPPMGPPTCPGDASGAKDFNDIVLGASRGGVDACGVEVGDTMDTETGNFGGQVVSGFESRLGGNVQSFEDVFDCSQDPCLVEDPDSPRLAIVPIIENVDGTTEWPSGTSGAVRVLSYVMVYIGDRSQPGYPATDKNGKTVYVTPVSAVMPESFHNEGTEYIGYDPDLDAPVVISLVE